MDVNFYLYFPTKEAAEKAADELQAEGFGVQVTLGADDVNWLILANRAMTHDEFDAADVRRMPELAASLGGEYDGYDRGVG
jgi:regulator of ribonuclease activity B